MYAFCLNVPIVIYFFVLLYKASNRCVKINVVC